MRIIFVRHGEPDYEHDCLTETGKRQASAAARRLAPEGISSIYSSPNGRARNTAEYTAEMLNLPITVLDYMHEISWGGPGLPDRGHPWGLAETMIDEENFDFFRQDWRQHPFWKQNTALTYYDMISEKIDAFLLGRGYRHEGNRFLCEGGGKETIALFSHGGSGACVLSHLLSLPFPYVCTVLPYFYTSVSILEFPSREGAYVHPRLELFNDILHLSEPAQPGGSGSPVAFQQVSE